MVNTKKKKQRRERQCREMYQDAGYQTWGPDDAPMNPQDIFDMFDFVAVPTTGGNVRFVQVKSNTSDGITEWADACVQRFQANAEFDFLVCFDGKGWKAYHPTVSGDYEVSVDERHTDCRMGEGVTSALREWV